MPRYKIIIEKKVGSEYWVNDYYLTATDIDDADSLIQPVVDAERAIHSTGVTFTQYRISTVTPDDGIFRNYVLNVQGLHTPGGQTLALWNCARFDFTADVGRSGRKYMRGVLDESSVAFDVLDPAMITFLDTNYAAPVRALGYLEKESGVLLNDCTINPFMAMRQLRRGSKRRVTPVL